mgnify:FL=1
MQNLIDVNKLNSILNTDGKNNKFSANKNDANKSEKLKELMNFKDLNKLGGSRMSEISSDFNDDNIDVASLKSYNFQQKNNNNANVNMNTEGNNGNFNTNYTEGILNTNESNNSKTNTNYNPNTADPNCLIF